MVNQAGELRRNEGRIFSNTAPSTIIKRFRVGGLVRCSYDGFFSGLFRPGLIKSKSVHMMGIYLFRRYLNDENNRQETLCPIGRSRLMGDPIYHDTNYR